MIPIEPFFLFAEVLEELGNIPKVAFPSSFALAIPAVVVGKTDVARRS